MRCGAAGGGGAPEERGKSRTRKAASTPLARSQPPLSSLPHNALRARARAFGFFPALVVNLWANHRTGREGDPAAANPAALLMERVTFSVGILLAAFLLFA